MNLAFLSSQVSAGGSAINHAVISSFPSDFEFHLSAAVTVKIAAPMDVLVSSSPLRKLSVRIPAPLSLTSSASLSACPVECPKWSELVITKSVPVMPCGSALSGAIRDELAPLTPWYVCAAHPRPRDQLRRGWNSYVTAEGKTISGTTKLAVPLQPTDSMSTLFTRLPRRLVTTQSRFRRRRRAKVSSL